MRSTLLLSAFLVPGFVYAKSLKEFTADIVTFVNTSVVPLIYALAFLFFLIGMVRFFFLGDSEENRQKGKSFMIWGVITFVVMFSVWGIVRLLMTALPG